MLKSKILSIYDELSKLESYEPCCYVNELFSDLVSLVTHQYPENEINDALDDKDVQSIILNLHKICALGEYYLENHWAEKIAESSTPSETLDIFPYKQNYLKLCNLEYQALVSTKGKKPESTIFLGAGPLPLSAIIFSSRYNINCTVLDKSIEACNQAKKTLDKLDINIRDVICMDSKEYQDYKNHDTIIFAALNGRDQKEKLEIIKNINKNNYNGIILFRSSHSLRKLLYPEIRIPEDTKLRKEIEIHS
ncbi:nicotianamine synthase family protein [Endozoicomonas atrinae]|uniref:nicotianamine synthase family protein n=1 Tax=Endozoicomonas atrinae TaxID=1333660 RepID=UPI000826B5EB|nr:nicotianamine synthase family protein [Endozoicomonas atrinae]